MPALTVNRVCGSGAQWTVADVDRAEINEAFAAMTLACLRELGLPEEVVNVEG
ncbi:MAG: acetyl-CoA C-acetyltransferase, partial [Pseudomonadales bacterium]